MLLSILLLLSPPEVDFTIPHPSSAPPPFSQIMDPAVEIDFPNVEGENRLVQAYYRGCLDRADVPRSQDQAQKKLELIGSAVEGCFNRVRNAIRTGVITPQNIRRSSYDLDWLLLEPTTDFVRTTIQSEKSQ